MVQKDPTTFCLVNAPKFTLCWQLVPWKDLSPQQVKNLSSNSTEKLRDNKPEQRAWNLKEIPNPELHETVKLKRAQSNDGAQRVNRKK